ncbi:hypothetical protein RJ641_006805 [Dillenia turbinata]|uniref:Uncharacterized protein n=1 Tax=Dillenia turbinata TaxID=194707 RepID=A0AAN8Z6F3_9MAGN
MVRKDVSQESSIGVDSMLLLGKDRVENDQNHDEDEDQESGASSEEFVESPKSVVVVSDGIPEPAPGATDAEVEALKPFNVKRPTTDVVDCLIV